MASNVRETGRDDVGRIGVALSTIAIGTNDDA
jgi:hypothetical protein